MEWGILVQRAMNARFIIIRGIPTQDPAQVRLPKYDQASRAAEFHHRALPEPYVTPGRSNRGPGIAAKWCRSEAVMVGYGVYS